MSCPDPEEFFKQMSGIDQDNKVNIDIENPLRYNVWGTTSEHIKNMLTNLSTEELPSNERNSASIFDKLTRTFKRIGNNTNKPTQFIKDVVDDKQNVAKTLALYEVMEAVKGESDKARNFSIDINSISLDGILPNLPAARIAAVIGRKLMYQQGFRIASTKDNPISAEQAEALYLEAGMSALRLLEVNGYVDFSKAGKNGVSIKDWTDAADQNKKYAGKDESNTTSDTLTISLNSKKLGIKNASQQEALYFTQRQKSDIADTELGAIADMLSAVRQVTQPARYTVPDKKATMTDKQMRDADDSKVKLGDTTHEVRKKLYEKELKVHGSVHDLLRLLHEEVKTSGLPASKVIKGIFNSKPGLLRSLFGFKDADAFSRDKLESIGGQNLSKTTAIDDLVEFYDLLMDNDKPAGLHLPLKVGRNLRLYYLNSVINPHASKQSRYMLTAGEQVIERESDNFDYLVYHIGQSLDKKLSYTDIVDGTSDRLEEALKTFEQYSAADNLNEKLGYLSELPKHFVGQDYVSILTSLQAIQDVRNPVNGSVTTEFTVSADATASGGTLTFFQALGTNPNIKSFLERLGMLVKDDGTVETSNADIYTLMTEAVDSYLKGEGPKEVAADLGVKEGEIKGVLTDTLNLLFDNGNDSRDFSKSATMTFVYQQGKEGSMNSMVTELADRVIENLDDPETRIYLAKLFKDSRFLENSKTELNATEDLYLDIKTAITDSKLPEQLYNLLGTSVKQKYLKENQTRSAKIFELVEKTLQNKVIKILPADAVLDGKKSSTDLAEYGMPIAKIFEVMHKMPDGTDVLTRKELLHKTIMDVSTIHAIDSALLYHALADVDFKDGVVVVHDDVRGSVETVRAVEKAYAAKAKEILAVYDIHEQMLEALKTYHPEIVDNADYKLLVAEVQTSVKVKQELSENFNLDTDALIGNGNKHVTFKEGGTSSKPKTESKGTTQEFLQDLAADSSLIQKFVSIFDTKAKAGKEFTFNPSLDEITVNTDSVDRKATIEAVEHEIVHAATVAQIKQALQGVGKDITKQDVRYFQKAIKTLLNRPSKGSTALEERLTYIKSQPSEEARISEFVAIMVAEPAIAKEVYKVFDKSFMSTVVASFIKRVKEFINGLSESDLQDDNIIDTAKLYGALNRTVNGGISDRLQNQQEVQNILKDIDGVYGYGKKPSVTDIDYLNKAVSRMIMDRAEEKGKTLLGSAHGALLQYEVYSDVIDKLRGVYDSSEAFQQLMQTITGEGVDKEKKAIVLAEFAKTTAQREDFVRDNLAILDELTGKLAKEEKVILDDSITQIPLHDYFVQAKELNTVESIDAEVSRLEAKFNKDGRSSALKDVANLVNLNVEGKITGKIYNLQGYSQDSDYHLEVRKFLALKTIQAMGTDKFVSLLKNEELMSKVQDMVTANHLSLIGISGKENLRASGIPHSYSEGVQQKVITLSEYPGYQYGEESGWKVIEAPTETSLGLVYRQVIDSTTLPGAFTDVKMSTSDISVTPEMKKYTNVLETPTGFKMILTEKHRKDMGSLGAVQSLVRSTAHALSIQESEIIRNMLLEEETTFKIGKDNTLDLENILKDDSIDNPWFLKADSIDYAELPETVKARYKPVGKRASDVNKFNESVTWVRKDISHWLLGGESSSPFTNPKWKWGLRVTKDLISMAKINMVILNPAKIATDNMSNIAYLGVMGVSPTFAYSSYKKIMEEYGEYTEVKNQLLALKVQLIAKPDSTKLKAKEKVLKNKLKQNDISSIEDKGFLNSLGSALISRESETLGGTQKDVNTALTYLLKQKDGKNNYAAHLLMQLQKVGPEGEGFLSYLGGIVGKAKSGKEFENELNKVSDRLSQIRSDKDMVAYASQFLSAPQSESVRFGASVTDLSDVMAKETYYRHLVEEGMSEQEAKIKVLDSFPNYTENMPMAVQQLSDVGILMFPSFWLRIQKVIYRMAKDRPLSLGTEEAIDFYLSTNIESIVDANVITKATSWGGLLHSPFETANLSAPFPTNAFNL